MFIKGLGLGQIFQVSSVVRHPVVLLLELYPMPLPAHQYYIVLLLEWYPMPPPALVLLLELHSMPPPALVLLLELYPMPPPAPSTPATPLLFTPHRLPDPFCWNAAYNYWPAS